MEIGHHVALVTGGASGLGAATVKLLASRGAYVAIMDQQQQAAAKMASSISNSIAIGGDVSNAADVDAAIAKITAAYNGIHIVVNCAGIAPAARLVGRNGPIDIAAFNQAVQVNLTGTVNIMSRAAAQIMQQPAVNADNERGVIINTASVAANEGQIGQAAYAASKGGVVSLTLPAARELASSGIRVMTIMPGVMATPMMSALNEECTQRLLANIPFPQRLGTAAEYAQLVVSIIENSYLNGTTIRLDGGLRMQSR